MARHITYWEYDGDAEIACDSCGWSGRVGAQEEAHRELLDVTCPQCDRMLLIVPFPTAEETRAAAAAGNRAAQAELGSLDRAEAFQARAAATALTDESPLPDLSGTTLTLTWDFEGTGFGVVTIIRHGMREIWRESAYYEGYERFIEVAAILQGRYGTRLKRLEPTQASSMYLYGDRYSSLRLVDAINEALAAGRDVREVPRH